MKVLLIKQSSLGDLIHCFPAVSDLKREFPDVEFDWLVEEGFAEVPKWHKGVNEAIPIAFRRWRKNLRQSKDEICDFLHSMHKRRYDVIIDAQALIKSSLIAKFVNKNIHGKKAKIVGLAKDSIRTEKFCTLFYHQKISVPLDKHAIWRVRQLFAGAFGYTFTKHVNEPLFPQNDCQFPDENIEKYTPSSPYIVGVHSTTWATKHLPIELWHDYIKIIKKNGRKLLLPWYGELELAYAKQVQASFQDTVHILPKLALRQTVSIMRLAEGVIAVDSGYAHIAAAMGIPTLALFGSTNSSLTSATGERSNSLQSTLSCSPCMRHKCQYSPSTSVVKTGISMYPPCYQSLDAQRVWDALSKLTRHKD